MAAASGWRSPWPFALLAASILSSCFLLAEGQGTTIQVLRQPLHPVEGNNVTLTPTPADIVQKALICRWFRGVSTNGNEWIFTYYILTNIGQTNGLAFTGRETAGPGCSLHIRNLTSDDTGNYTVTLEGPEINLITGSAYVVVSGSSVSRSLEAGSLAGILVGSLAILALNGTLLYFIFRARGQKTSGQIEAAPSSSDNFDPSRQVKTESSADNHVYQTLQHGDRATYDQLNIATDKSTDLYAVAE